MKVTGHECRRLEGEMIIEFLKGRRELMLSGQLSKTTSDALLVRDR
jgi:hypothetical protein